MAYEPSGSTFAQKDEGQRVLPTPCAAWEISGRYRGAQTLTILGMAYGVYSAPEVCCLPVSVPSYPSRWERGVTAA